MVVIEHYECSGCRSRLKEGEFMAIIGKMPPESLSTPIGRYNYKTGGGYLVQ
jgi:hypothetical protein